MKVTPLDCFVCPLDGKILKKKANSLACDQGHTFDIAREGYCNLLLVQQKASLDPGDNKEMVSARKAFLDAGYFVPLAALLFQTICAIQKDWEQDQVRIVDAGCGEGYYLDYCSVQALKLKQKRNLALAGCDISKWALKAAAKRSKEIAWAVAANRQLPFAPGTIDVIVCMFGFPDWKNFQTVQSSKGYVILVEPGFDHLRELRNLIYPEVNETRKFKPENYDGYRLESTEQLKFSVELNNNPAIHNLLSMTPHAYRISQEAYKKIEHLKRLTVTADITFRILRKS